MKGIMTLTRFGVPIIAFVLVASSPVLGRAQSHYGIQGSLQSTKDAHASVDGRITLHGTLTPAMHVQSGAGYSMLSHVDSPLVCVADLIFANGFEL